MPRKPTFFERLTGTVRLDDYESDAQQNIIEDSAGRDTAYDLNPSNEEGNSSPHLERNPFETTEEEEGTLNVDVYETADEVVVKTMCAGVRPEELEVNIMREEMSIRGERHEDTIVNEENFHARELYWGAFSRTLPLPAEVEPEEAEATEKHGLLIIRIPKIKKDKRAKIKVKSA